MNDVNSANYPKLIGKKVARFCPNGHRFVVRANREDGSLFLGCSKYPECRETAEIPTDLLLQLTGATPLPGFAVSEEPGEDDQ